MTRSTPAKPERRFRKSEAVPIAAGLTGTVIKWLDRGYGFIKHADYPSDIFAHAQNVIGLPPAGALVPNQRVAFDLVETSKGLAAVNVTPIE
jgi:CspA family cold shock protein